MNQLSVRCALLASLVAAVLPARAETQDAPFINQWLISGPFPEVVEAAAAKPSAGTSFGGKAWEYFDDRLWNRNYDNYQDLFGYYSIRKGVDTRNQYVYAHSYVFSPSDQSVEFRFGTSGTDRLFVNGAEVRRDTTPQEVQRDMRKQNIALKKGWNQILLEIRHDYTADKNANGAEIAKDASVSYLGLYGRVSDTNGNEVSGIQYSVAGESPTLTIDTQALAAADVIADPSAKGRGLPSNALPIGYMEWPYVWNKSRYAPRETRGVQADPYRFQASGGSPGYRFELVTGALPDGLTLGADGAIGGFCTKMGTFPFTLQVTDSVGKIAQKKLSITVKDRPNRWFEEGRVGALSHCIAVYPFWVDANWSADLWAERAKRQGHSLVSVESLQQNYYWPSNFEDPKHPRNQYQPRDKDGKVLDGLKAAEEAVKRHGMKFGLYYATEGGGLEHYSSDVFIQNTSDLIRRYDPAYLYYDGPQRMRGANYDAMLSNVRNYSDDIVVNINVSLDFGDTDYSGDADLGTTEASHIYAGANPVLYTKRIVIEPWKSIHTKHNPTPYYEKRDDFRQVAKEMVMNASRGYVDNNDQMPLMSRGPNWDSPANIAQRYPMAVQEFIDVREGVAGWFTQPGIPNLHESTTGTVPYFLSGFGYDDDGKGNISAFAHGKGPDWGYATARDHQIYLHFIKGPDGKKGYTGQSSITISPVKHKVQYVTWLNVREHKPLKFQQTGDSLTITLDGLTQDPVDTIVKISTANPARKYHLTNLIATGKQDTPSSLQILTEGYATYPALKVPFAHEEPFTNGKLRFTSDNPAVAKVDDQGRVTAIASGKAVITVEGTYEGATAKDTLPVVVNDRKFIHVDGDLTGVVLKINGKEAYTTCAGTAPLPLNLEGRLQKGGPVSLQSAGKVTLKWGVVDYAKGTQKQPVVIEEKPLFTVNKEYLFPVKVEELTRAAVWAEVELDGKTFTSNKVFVDMEPRLPVSLLTEAKIASSGHLGNFTAEKIRDGVTIARNGSDSSKWSAAGNAPSWIAFDFRSAQKISGVSIHFNTLDQAYLNTPETMEIQASVDGRQWNTIGTFTPPAQGSGAYFGFANVYQFKPVQTRYVRLNFPKGNPKGDSVDLLEVMFYDNLIKNLAVLAKIKASSEFDARYTGANIADGIVGEHGNGEWASKGEANPWIRLEWDGKTTINRIILRDRPHPEAFTKQGRLTFSDGSSIQVSDIPNDGSPKTITFPPKSVQWLQFQTTDSQTTNNGLSELSVFGPE